MRTEHRAILERLAKAGINLIVLLDTSAGSEAVSLNVDQALAYIADPLAFASRHFGLYVEDYRAWVNSGGIARCSAMTKAGNRCGNSVLGAAPLSAWEWRTREDGFCGLHHP